MIGIIPLTFQLKTCFDAALSARLAPFGPLDKTCPSPEKAAVAFSGEEVR